MKYYLCTVVLAFTLHSLHAPGSHARGGSEVVPPARFLHRDLFANHSKAIRPRLNQSETVEVYFDIVLRQLTHINVKTQMVKLLVWLRQTWVDESLAWDPRRYRSRTTRVDPRRIWIPAITIQNGIDHFEHLKEISVLDLRVNYRGKVLWMLPLEVSATCEMDVTYFPYDDQRCSIIIASWSNKKHQVDVLFYKKIRMDKHDDTRDHLEWQLIHAARKREEYRSSNGDIPILLFHYTFSRDPKYYEFTMVLPTFLICLMAIASFALPHECGEKVSFSITIFLALVVNLVIISQSIPVSSETFPILGMFFFLGIWFVGASVALTQVVLLISTSTLDPGPIPETIRRFLLGRLAKLTCIDIGNIDLDHQFSYQKNVQSSADAADNGDNTGGSTETSTAGGSRSGGGSGEAHVLMTVVGRVERSAFIALKHAREKEELARIGTEWALVGSVIDRLLMAAFALICAAFSSVFAYWLWSGARRQHLRDMAW